MIGTTDLEDQATTTSTGGRTPIFSPERAARQGDRGLFSRVRGPGLGPTRGRASWADRDHRAIAPLWRTADWGHLRLHHGHAPWGRYDWGCLTYWAGLIAETFTNAEDVFVYFNNDPGCSAVDDAITFAEAVRQTGQWVTRVPERRPAWGADDPVWAAAAP